MAPSPWGGFSARKPELHSTSLNPPNHLPPTTTPLLLLLLLLLNPVFRCAFSDMRRLLEPCWWILFLKITSAVLHYVVCFPGELD